MVLDVARPNQTPWGWSTGACPLSLQCLERAARSQPQPQSNTHTHTHTSTHTLEQRSILSMYPDMLVCVDVCIFSLKDDGLVTGHM